MTTDEIRQKLRNMARAYGHLAAVLERINDPEAAHTVYAAMELCDEIACIVEEEDSDG